MFRNMRLRRTAELLRERMGRLGRAGKTKAGGCEREAVSGTLTNNANEGNPRPGGTQLCTFSYPELRLLRIGVRS